MLYKPVATLYISVMMHQDAVQCMVTDGIDKWAALLYWDGMNPLISLIDEYNHSFPGVDLKWGQMWTWEIG